MPPEEIAFRPSRAKQIILLAYMLIMSLFCAAGLVLLWPLDPTRLENIVARTILYNLHALILVVLAVLAVFGAVLATMLAVLLVLNAPVFTMTADGILLRGKTLIRWEEIDEIHEFVDRTTNRPLKQVLVGIYPRDAAATSAKLGRTFAWQMDFNRKHGLPPIALPTQHLQASAEEVVDAIEAYIEKLRAAEGKGKWPSVYRRQD